MHILACDTIVCSRLSNSGEDAKEKGTRSFIFVFALSQFRLSLRMQPFSLAEEVARLKGRGAGCICRLCIHVQSVMGFSLDITPLA